MNIKGILQSFVFSMSTFLKFQQISNNFLILFFPKCLSLGEAVIQTHHEKMLKAFQCFFFFPYRNVFGPLQSSLWYVWYFSKQIWLHFCDGLEVWGRRESEEEEGGCFPWRWERGLSGSDSHSLKESMYICYVRIALGPVLNSIVTPADS